MATVKLIIEASTAGATKALKNLNDVGEKAVSGIGKATLGLKNALLGIKGQVLGLIGAYAGFRAITAATEQLGEFSKAVQEVRSIADDSIRSNDELGKSFIKTAQAFGTSATVQAKTFYQIISAGITDAEKAQQTLIAANKLAIGGLASTESAVDILTSALNVYAESNLDAEVAADDLFTAVRIGKTNVESLASSLGLVLPLSQKLGVSFKDVTGAVSALTVKGVETSIAVTQIRSLFASLLKVQGDLVKESPAVAKAFDLNALKTKDFATFIDDLNKSVGGSDVKLLDLLGRQEALLAVQSLASDGAKVLASSLDAMGNSAGAADRAFQDLEGAVGRQLDKLRANISNLVLSVAVEGEDEVLSFLENVNRSLLNLSGNQELMQRLMKSVINLVKLLGTVFIETLVVMDGLIKKFSKFGETVRGIDPSKIEKALVTGRAGIMKDRIDELTKSIDKYQLKFLTVATQEGTLKEVGDALKNVKGGFEKSLTDQTVDTFREFVDVLKDAAGAFNNVEESVEKTKKTIDSMSLGKFELLTGGKMGPLLPDETQFETFKRNLEGTLAEIGTKANTFIDNAIDSTGDLINEAKQFSLDDITLDGITSGISAIGTGIKDAFVAAAPIIGDSLKIGAKVFTTIFGGGFIDILGQAFESVAGLPEQFLKAVKSFDKLMKQLIDGLVEVIADLPAIFSRVFDSFIARFPLLIEKTVEALGVIADLIADAAPHIVAAIVKGATQLVQNLPAIIDKIAKGLAPLLDSFLKNLPTLITAIFDALPLIVKSLADQIGPVVEAFARHADVIVLALVEGLIGSSGEIINALVQSLLVEGGLERIVVALVKAMPRVALALVQGIVRGLARAGDAIGTGMGRGFRVGVGNIGKTIGDQMGASISTSIASQASKIFVNVRKPSFKIAVEKVKALDVTFKQPGWVRSFQDALNNFGPGGGGGGGGGIKLPSFQTGGLMPQTGLANLHQGELVTPPKTTENLFRLIDGLSDKINRQENVRTQPGAGEGTQNLNLSINVGESELANVLLNLNRQGFRVA